MVNTAIETPDGTAYLAHEHDTEGAELAWSLDATSGNLCADDSAMPARRSWAIACGLAAALLAFGAAASAALLLGMPRWAPPSKGFGEGEIASAAPPVEPVSKVPEILPRAPETAEHEIPPTALPTIEGPSTPTAAVPDQDAAYLAALRESGITITDPAQAVAGGRSVCTYLRQGHSQAEAVALGMKENPRLSPMDAIHAVTAAVLAFCPEMNRR